MIQSKTNQNTLDQNSPINKKPQKSYFLLLSLLISVTIGVFLILPAFDQYTMAQNKIKTIKFKLNDLTKELEKLKIENKKVENKTTEKNKLETRNLNKALPKEENSTNIVRMFDNFAYTYNTTNQPININVISFSKLTQNKKTKENTMSINLNINSSLENFERFLFFLETSGTIDPKDLINEKQLDALKIILDETEQTELETIIATDFNRDTIAQYIEKINAPKAKEKLINELFTKNLFYKEVRQAVEDRYYPIPVFSIETFNLQLPRTKNGKIDSKGLVNFNVKLIAYYQ